MLIERDVDKDLQQQLAQQVGAWKSWTYGEWFTDGSVLIRLPFPVTTSHRMLLDCSCEGEQRDREHYLDTTRDCVYVDKYEEDEFAKKHIEYLFSVGLGTPSGERTLTFRDERNVMIADCPIPLACADGPEGTWVAVQNRQYEALVEMAYPDTWEVREYQQEQFEVTAPIVTAYRRGVLVGLMSITPADGSVYTRDAHAKFLEYADSVIHRGHGCPLDRQSGQSMFQKMMQDMLGLSATPEKDTEGNEDTADELELTESFREMIEGFLKPEQDAE